MTRLNAVSKRDEARVDELEALMAKTPATSIAGVIEKLEIPARAFLDLNGDEPGYHITHALRSLRTGRLEVAAAYLEAAALACGGGDDWNEQFVRGAIADLARLAKDPTQIDPALAIRAKLDENLARSAALDAELDPSSPQAAAAHAAQDALGEEFLSLDNQMVATPASTLEGVIAKLDTFPPVSLDREDWSIEDRLLQSAIDDLRRFAQANRASELPR